MGYSPIFIMKTINIPITGNSAFDSVSIGIWNAYASINYGDDTFFEDEDKEYISLRLKQVLKRLNKLSKYVPRTSSSQ